MHTQVAPGRAVLRFFAMGGSNEIQVFAQSREMAERGGQLVVAEVARIEAKYSRYRADSILSAINASAGGPPVHIDAETAGLLDYADTCFRLSHGLFDITSGILRKAWDFRPGKSQGRLPDPELLGLLLHSVGWNKVWREGSRVQLPTGMELDLGGVAKEYAVDRACAVLIAAGLHHALVNFAGDTRALGPQPLAGTRWSDAVALETSPWTVGVAHPRQQGHLLCSVAINEGAVATSGDYERFIEIDGQRYCHILDPRTGFPVRHWQSVTVTAPLCIAAGSASTIGMLMQEDAEASLHALGLDFLAVSDSQSVATGIFGT